MKPEKEGIDNLTVTVRRLSTMPATCKYCQSDNVVRAGTRTRKDGTARQLYLCKDCLRRFSNSNPTDKRTVPGAILLTLTHYCQGYSYADIAYILKRKFRIRRTRSALCKWVREFEPPYLAIREKMTNDARPVRSFLFTHRELNYMYQYHRPKLRFAKRFPGLVDYLETIADRLDHSIFEDASHCSNMKLLQNPGLSHHTNTLLSKLTGHAVALAESNRQRHQAVEDYFLSCDRNTIAVEVPVYMYDKRLGSIAGHVDVLQVNRGRVLVLDYKPNAKKENPGKVATQLTLYANALALRTKTPISEFSCGYFDKSDAYFFTPARLDQIDVGNGFETFQRERTG